MEGQSQREQRKWSANETKRAKKKEKKETRRKDKNKGTEIVESLLQYLKLDVVHRWGGDHTVEGGEAMLIANLLAVQLKLRLTHLPVHIQSHHSLRRETEAERGWIILPCVR